MTITDINLAKKLKLTADEFNKYFIENELNEIVAKIKYLLMDASELGNYTTIMSIDDGTELCNKLFSNNLFIREAKKILELDENGFRVNLEKTADGYNYSRIIIQFGDSLE